MCYQRKNIIGGKKVHLVRVSFPQLKYSFSLCFSNNGVYLEGEDNNSFEISPYPIPIFARILQQFFIFAKNNIKRIMICGKYGKEIFEAAISNIKED